MTYPFVKLAGISVQIVPVLSTGWRKSVVVQQITAASSFCLLPHLWGQAEKLRLEVEKEQLILQAEKLKEKEVCWRERGERERDLVCAFSTAGSSISASFLLLFVWRVPVEKVDRSGWPFARFFFFLSLFLFFFRFRRKNNQEKAPFFSTRCRFPCV